MSLNPVAANTLRKVVTATQQGQPAFLKPGAAKQLLALAYIVGSTPPVTDDEGQEAFMATPAGVAALATAPAANEAPAERKQRPAMVVSGVVSGFVMPEVNKGGRGGGSRYPFEKLNPPTPVVQPDGSVTLTHDVFFVPNSADRPDAYKSIAGTVTAANRRLKPMKFRAAAIPDGAQFGYAGVGGAVVARVE